MNVLQQVQQHYTAFSSLAPANAEEQYAHAAANLFSNYSTIVAQFIATGALPCAAAQLLEEVSYGMACNEDTTMHTVGALGVEDYTDRLLAALAAVALANEDLGLARWALAYACTSMRPA